MARTGKTFSDDDARDTLSLATVLGTLPMELVRKSLEATGGQSRRRRKLPHDLVMCLVILLCVYRDKATDEVLRHLLQGVRGQLGCDVGLCATDSAISQAREAIGEEPMRLLYRSLCRPLCAREGGGHGWHQGMLKCAIDASEIYLQSTQDVMREFPTAEATPGTPRTARRSSSGR